MRTMSCDEAVTSGSDALAVSPIAESMAIAVLGSEAFRNGNCLLDNPRISKVFSHDAQVRTVELGDGLWSALRVSPDGTVTVLFVHNATGEPRTFAPADALPGKSAEPIHFIRGEMRTLGAGSPGDTERTLCELAAHSFAWLARFEDGGH